MVTVTTDNSMKVFLKVKTELPYISEVTLLRAYSKGHQNSKRILHPKCTLAPFSIDKILETSKMSKDR